MKTQFPPSMFTSGERLDLSQDHEVLYWSQRLGISPERLRQVVRGAGPDLSSVQRALWRLDQTRHAERRA